MSLPTRVEKTEADYLKRAQGRLQAYLKERERDWDLHEDDFLSWLGAYRETISKASWRQNRAALVWYMKTIAMDTDLAGTIADIGTFACSEATKTSATKKKSLSERDSEQLTKALIESHERYVSRGGKEEESTALRTLLFLGATEITGLRPSEWWGSELLVPGEMDASGNIVDKPTLIVKNGKATNGRAHGESRTLRFTDLSEERWLTLLTHYRSVKNLPDKEAFQDYYTACKDRMTYTTRKLWPSRKRNPVLYSGRHQFSANLKQAKTAIKTIAALMGHGSDATATSHYGKKKFGRGNECGVEADPSEIERIREKAGNRYTEPENSTVTVERPHSPQR
ncbi:hypothetical protein [Neptuniibacter halophilus]|uniref:hypothetical protein n=1 Tax=Neptuniibacter halophilus TaxID=651666 RepID=UPI002572F710|nr:hypothetical protein [Neptuniibacter halophilus]